MRAFFWPIAGLVIGLALAGCGGLPERVLVPVPVPCQQELPEVPAWATDTLDDDSSIWEQVRALLAERRQRIAYEDQLRVKLSACWGSAAEASGLGR